MVSDGEEALKKIKKYNYDFIFLDLKMLNMPGEVLLEKLIKKQKLNSKFIIVSGALISKAFERKLSSLGLKFKTLSSPILNVRAECRVASAFLTIP